MMMEIFVQEEAIRTQKTVAQENEMPSNLIMTHPHLSNSFKINLNVITRKEKTY